MGTGVERIMLWESRWGLDYRGSCCGNLDGDWGREDHAVGI